MNLQLISSQCSVSRSFSARRSCKSRSYVYLMPIKALGVGEQMEGEDVSNVLEKLRKILGMFEVNTIVAPQI